jgi:hypothetical protein
MPEFILNTPPGPREIRAAAIANGDRASKARQPHPFHDLDCLAQGYVEAMFFTNGDIGDERENLLNEWGVACLTPDSVAAIARDCAAFEKTVAADGRTVREILDSVADRYDDSQAGADFWFTRQGHGVGFWSRRELESDDSEYERLTDAMVEANSRRDSAAWDAAVAQRDKLDSPGKLLDGCAKQFREVYCEAYRRKIHHP